MIVGAMSVTIREMRPEDARRFLEIHHAAVRHIAANDYPTSVVEAWARPITDQVIERFVANRDQASFEARLAPSLYSTIN
jgi:hypothetical protein